MVMSKPKTVIVNRHDIRYDVTALLKRVFTTTTTTTTSAGGFFFIPYLLQLSAHDFLSAMGPTKPQGIPKESLALGIVFESIFGYTAGIRAVDSVSRTDFGLLAGLPFLPSPSTQYRYLQSVSAKEALDFQSSVLVVSWSNWARSRPVFRLILMVITSKPIPVRR